MNNQSTEELTGDNYTLPIENTTTTHQQHYRSGVAVGDNGNDDDDNGEIDFEDNAPDSVDKLLSDTTTNKIPLNSSSPTRDNNGNNDNLNNEAYTTTNHIDENDLIFLTTTTTTSSMSPPLELLPPPLPSQLSLTMLPTKDTTLWSTTATNTTAKETHLQNSSPLDITSASLSTCNFVVYDDDDDGGGGGGGESEGVGRAVDNADEEGDNDDDDCCNYQSFEDLKSISKEEDILNATINRIDTVNETTEHDSHDNNNKVNTNDDDNRRTHNEMNRILNHLEMLSINSEKQSKQFEYILDQLNETKLKLERLEQTQFDIIEQINNINYQGSLMPPTQPSNIVTMTESNVNLEHWEIKSIELSNQIISQ
ncbi:unnamed protein product, partial [Schistosoma curassoni]